MKKHLFSTLLLLVLSSPTVFADATPETTVVAPETKAVVQAEPAKEVAQAEPAAKVDPREAIKEKRAAHQSYMQEQRQKMREVKSDEERRALIEGQREYMQEYMEEMHELMRAAQETEGQSEELDDNMMPPPPYGYGPGPRMGWDAPYGRMPRMPYGYGPRGWDRDDMPSMNEEGADRPCQNSGKHKGHYEEMQKRLDRIEKLLENLQAK